MRSQDDCSVRETVLIFMQTEQIKTLDNEKHEIDEIKVIFFSNECSKLEG